MYLKIVTFIFLVLTLTQSLSRVSVGSSPGFGICDYLTIQEALNSGENEIRILNNQDFIENIVIDHAVDIRGGFLSCFNANGNVAPAGNTTIKGTAIPGESVITIMTTGDSFVRLYNLIIRDAIDIISNPNKGHGIEMDDATGTIEIIDSVIVFNRAISGGGLYLKNNNSFFRLTVNLRNSVILGNFASASGAGAYCSGTNAHLNIIEESSIKGNSATNGGGIAAFHSCRVLISSGVDVNNSNLHRGIMINSASQNGGGVYARFSARVTFDGSLYDGVNTVNSTKPATLANNTAGFDGGGIYAIDSAIVNVHDSLIDSNLADHDGGGIYVDSSSVLNISPSGKKCWELGGCIVISNNKSLRFGGGVYISNDGAIVQTHYILNSKLFGNRADFGTALYLNGPQAQALLYGNYIYNNGLDGSGSYTDNFVLRANDNSELVLIHNTIVDNDINNSRAVIGNRNSSIFIFNTIIHNNETVLEEFGSTSNNHLCLLVNEDLSLTGSNIFVNDPGFINSANNDYHLNSDSFSIDSCSNPPAFELDSDLEQRGFDDPTITNIQGSYDVGADETYVNDIIFSSSFE